VALVVYRVFVIGLIDNLLRAMPVGKDTRMPDAAVMITSLGGMAVFGINGFVLGPRQSLRCSLRCGISTLSMRCDAPTGTAP
jgi:hypothetical protein